MTERYTLMLPCDMLLAAIDVANSRRVSSVTGIGYSCVFAQKLVNFFHPAEYVFLVVGERPRVMKCSAQRSSCSMLKEVLPVEGR